MKKFVKNLIYIVVVLAISFGIKEFVLASFTVSGDSMSPTLQDGQNMFMYKLGSVERFSVVVIQAPDGAKDENGNLKAYIKRVIGMPGDTIEYKNDVLYINGQAYDEPYLDAAKAALPAGTQLTPDFTLTSLVEKIKKFYPNLPAENTTLDYSGQTATIPAGYYLVLGDNRQFSKDGDEFGLVKGSLIEGIAVMRYWPFDKIGVAPFK